MNKEEFWHEFGAGSSCDSLYPVQLCVDFGAASKKPTD
jgi:hypothetical protein